MQRANSYPSSTLINIVSSQPHGGLTITAKFNWWILGGVFGFNCWFPQGLLDLEWLVRMLFGQKKWAKHSYTFESSCTVNIIRLSAQMSGIKRCNISKTVLSLLNIKEMHFPPFYHIFKLSETLHDCYRYTEWFGKPDIPLLILVNF